MPLQLLMLLLLLLLLLLNAYVGCFRSTLPPPPADGGRRHFARFALLQDESGGHVSLRDGLRFDQFTVFVKLPKAIPNVGIGTEAEIEPLLRTISSLPLHLTKQMVQVGPNFLVTTSSANGSDHTAEVLRQANECTYVGKVRNTIRSIVTANLCEEFFAASFMLESAEDVNVTRSRASFIQLTVKKHRLSDFYEATIDIEAVIEEQSTEGEEGRQECSNNATYHREETTRRETGSHRQKREAYTRNQYIRYIELYFVVSYSAFEWFYERECDGMRVDLCNSIIVQRLIYIVGRANSLFRPVNIVVVPVGLHIFDHDARRDDLVELNSDSEVNTAETIRKVYWFIQQNVRANNISIDHVHLITQRLRESTLGLTSTGHICTYTRSISFADIAKHGRWQRGWDAYAATLTHELGHALSLVHDSEIECERMSNRRYIMCPTHYDSMDVYWSEASKLILLQPPYALQMDTCLSNNPLESVNGRGHDFGLIRGQRRYDPFNERCGDGVVDVGEECDCGQIDKNCDCCNATTCKLLADAECASGACCDLGSCRLKPVGATCQNAGVDDCSFARCTKSGECHIQPAIDGRDCDQRRGYCIGGMCRSLNKQCEMILGRQARQSSDNCHLLSLQHIHAPSGDYRFFDEYSKSDLEHQRCKVLTCESPTLTSAIMRYGFTRFDLKLNEQNKTCYYFPGTVTFDNQYYYPIPSDLMPIRIKNFTKCGDSKACYRGRCMEKSKLSHLFTILPQRMMVNRKITSTAMPSATIKTRTATSTASTATSTSTAAPIRTVTSTSTATTSTSTATSTSTTTATSTSTTTATSTSTTTATSTSTTTATSTSTSTATSTSASTATSSSTTTAVSTSTATSTSTSVPTYTFTIATATSSTSIAMMKKMNEFGVSRTNGSAPPEETMAISTGVTVTSRITNARRFRRPISRFIVNKTVTRNSDTEKVSLTPTPEVTTVTPASLTTTSSTLSNTLNPMKASRAPRTRAVRTTKSRRTTSPPLTTTTTTITTTTTATTTSSISTKKKLRTLSPTKSPYTLMTARRTAQMKLPSRSTTIALPKRKYYTNSSRSFVTSDLGKIGRLIPTTTLTSNSNRLATSVEFSTKQSISTLSSSSTKSVLSSATSISTSTALEYVDFNEKSNNGDVESTHNSTLPNADETNFSSDSSVTAVTTKTDSDYFYGISSMFTLQSDTENGGTSTAVPVSSITIVPETQNTSCSVDSETAGCFAIEHETTTIANNGISFNDENSSTTSLDNMRISISKVVICLIAASIVAAVIALMILVLYRLHRKTGKYAVIYSVSSTSSHSDTKYWISDLNLEFMDVTPV